MWCVLYCIFVIAVVHGSPSHPVANTNYGKIRGKYFASQSGIIIASFLGIPYAEPPVRELRFKVTQSNFLNIIEKLTW